MIFREIYDVFYFTPAVLCGPNASGHFTVVLALWCWCLEFTFSRDA